jgi:hypothetical protein
MLYTNEQRGVLQLTLDVGGKQLYFMDTHIDFRPGDAERLKNVGELKQLVAAHHDLPIIICGDFNSKPDSSTHKDMSEFLTDPWPLCGKGPGFSFPADAPNRRLGPTNRSLRPPPGNVRVQIEVACFWTAVRGSEHQNNLFKSHSPLPLSHSRDCLGK